MRFLCPAVLLWRGLLCLERLLRFGIEGLVQSSGRLPARLLRPLVRLGWCLVRMPNFLLACLVMGIAWGSYMTATAHLNSPRVVPPRKLHAVLPHFERELRCLVDNVFFEARGEPEFGRRLVVHVTLNRWLAPYYPNTICGVVYQRNSRSCAFSWTCDGIPDRVSKKEERLYKELEQTVRILLRETIDGVRLDESLGSDHYHATRMSAPPYWAPKMRQEMMTVGQHVFYKSPLQWLLEIGLRAEPGRKTSSATTRS